jgi:hypothetical protein
VIAFLLSPRAGKTACSLAITALLLVLAGPAWAQQAPQESLGDYARRLRTSKKAAVVVSAEDAERLFHSVDEITKFDSKDSGFPKQSPVQRKLIGQVEAEKHFRSEGEDEARHDRRLEESAIVLKKFGMLPADFDLNAKLGDITLSGLAGFYDFSDQTMYLLNWIAPELQSMVMAHELTHALQDQNYHLSKFAVRPPEPEAKQMKMEDDESESFLARRAVVEGQATLVGDDYEIRDLGISLANSPEARERVISHLQSSYDLPVTINNAPRLLREVMIFPYREGLIFELELLDRGGRETAFREAFQRPPLNTHQILQPEAYFAHEKTPRIAIGDLTPVFGKDYVAYDSGTIGELDVQIMSEEFGRENDIYSVARQWNGGAYVAVKRAGLAAGSEVKTSDLALVYVSRWKSQKAAERFGQIYLDAMAKRLPMSVATQKLCDEEPCRGPLWERHADSSEGPVNVELWPGNLLIITQSVDQARMQALRPILLAEDKTARAAAAAPEPNQPGLDRPELDQPELAARLLAMPQIEALSKLEGLALGNEVRQLLAH